MKIVEILNEKLEDIAIGNILTHKTTIESLDKIFEDGFLQGYTYTISSGSTPNKMLVLKNKEIATARNSGKMRDDELSSNIGRVTFFIYKDRLQGSHLFRRGKVKTIAELPMENYRRAAQKLYNILGRVYNKEQKDIIFELLKREFENTNKKHNIYQFIDAVFVATGRKVLERDISTDDLKYLINEVNGLKKFLDPQKRESEERLIIDKLPLDKRIMSIRFEPKALKESFFSTELHKNDYKNLLKNIKKYDDLIQNTPEKTAIIKYLEKI